ncbi:tripartite tricarboxylate transporter substrate binding protein [Sulfitobacter sp. W074]|uniref:Bug family tripartite tricarboxylate transporter substrate binding protein n=1 Tax=Sulfitobacter sp. W074 TaxID=2867026 RepID=UPI0021A35C8A|nr:tripartite tricarboxylate transporter substrate binding protein [Sulfitobacter sp. W074]UWR39512.1 tripartite tricarboxylate transporter substrate binding protein [Sulfitobacter sp. W074]
MMLCYEWEETMQIFRRVLLGAILMSTLLGTSVIAKESDPITLVLPYSAGGPTDGLTRYLADGLSKITDRTFLVENKPGANGIIAAQFVARTRAPQNTLLVGGTGPISLNTMLRKNLPFSLEDFQPVSLVASGPMAVTVPVSSGLETLEDFVAQGKSKPLRFGTFGPGSLSQLYGALLSNVFDLDLIEVSYKTTAEEVKDILGGQVDFTVSSPFGVIGQIQAGEMKMLGVALPERMEQLPEVPTFAELGYPELTASFWTGIFAPTAMDVTLVAEINSALAEIISKPETQEMLSKIGQFAIGGEIEVLSEQLHIDREKWGGVIEERGIVLE